MISIPTKIDHIQKLKCTLVVLNTLAIINTIVFSTLL